MKYTTLFLPLLLVVMVSCGKEDHTVPAIKVPGGNEPVEQPKPGELYSWEKSRTEILDYTDMVLLYGGGRQRYIPNWDTNRLSAYVSYTDKGGHEKWFFDSFLFLEFADYGSGSAMVTYATGYKDPVSNKILDSATKKDWERLIDYYFLKL